MAVRRTKLGHELIQKWQDENLIGNSGLPLNGVCIYSNSIVV